MAQRKIEVPEVGAVVRSKTGRDRKRVFLVVGYDEKNVTSPVIIANGTLRRIEDAKHKNPAHLEYLGTIVESERNELFEDFTNSKIAEICSKYDIHDNFA